MNKITIIAIAAIAACAGCNTTRIGADPVALGTATTTTYIDGDTSRVASVTTTPIYAFGWWANSYRNLMDTQIADMAFRYGEASASVHGYGNTVNVEAVKSLADLTSDIVGKAVAGICAYYGGGAVSATSSLGSLTIKDVTGKVQEKLAKLGITDANCSMCDADKIASEVCKECCTDGSCNPK